MAESTPLTAAEEGQEFMGVKMQFPTEQYHWAFVFELIPPDEKPIVGLAKCLGQKTVKESYDEEMPQEGDDGVQATLKQIFTDRAQKEFCQKKGFGSVKTKREFHRRRATCWSKS